MVLVIDQAFQANPYPQLRSLYSASPINWTNWFGGTWLLHRYEDVEFALGDPRFSVERINCFLLQFSEEDQHQLADLHQLFSAWMLFLDPPKHSRLRKLMNHGFAPRLINYLIPRIQTITNELLNDLITKQKMYGSVDFMTTFAHILPAIVIAEMLGVDPSDRAELIGWSNDVAAFFGSAVCNIETALRTQNSLIQFSQYFQNLLPERRKNPGEDLVSLLVQAEEAGDFLTEEDILAQCSMLLFGGHETTRNLLGNGLLSLLQHPDQLNLLREDPSLMRSAIKELLRYESPIAITSRMVNEDMHLHGQFLQKGQLAVLSLSAANRDPAKFDESDQLDVTRYCRPQTPPSLAFGRGVHTCLGQGLAIVEAEIAFKAILERLPKTLYLVNEQPDWNSNLNFRGLNSLAIAF